MRLVLIFLLMVSFSIGTTTIAQTTVSPDELVDENGQFIEIDGISVYYVEAGDTNAPTIILLNGFTLSSHFWLPTVDVLVEAGYHVIAYDRPPFGLSDKSLDWTNTPEAQVELLNGLMTALDVDSAIMVGHSEGAGVAAYFAVEHPDRVDGLAFVGGHVGVTNAVDNNSRVYFVEEGSVLAPLFTASALINIEVPLAANLARSTISSETIATLATEIFANPDALTPDIVAGIERMLLVEGWELPLVKVFQTPIIGRDFELAQLADLNVPLAVYHGDLDNIVQVEIAEHIVDVLPDTALVIYPGVGHAPMYEVPTFHDDLLEFLAGISAS